MSLSLTQVSKRSKKEQSLNVLIHLFFETIEWVNLKTILLYISHKLFQLNFDFRYLKHTTFYFCFVFIKSFERRNKGGIFCYFVDWINEFQALTCRHLNNKSLDNYSNLTNNPLWIQDHAWICPFFDIPLTPRLPPISPPLSKIVFSFTFLQIRAWA